MYVEQPRKRKSDDLTRKIVGGMVMVAVCVTVGVLVIYAIKKIAESEMPPTKEPESSEFLFSILKAFVYYYRENYSFIMIIHLLKARHTMQRCAQDFRQCC